MHDEATILENARCLTCEYQLQGLPEPVCPECGRSFDPADPCTFDTRPDGWRRRRWIKRGCIALAIALVAFSLFPRRLIKSSMTFTCTTCGDVQSERRVEPQLPSWVPFRYPGFHSASQQPPSTATSATPCTTHSHSVNVRFDLYYGGSCSGTGWAPPGRVVTFNDMPARLDTASMVLKKLTEPANNGILVYSKPVVSPEPVSPTEESE